MRDITVLLDDAVRGDRNAQDELYRRTEPELRKLALHWIMRKGVKGPVRTTEVIDRAFLKLMRLGPRDWQHRGHFYVFACRNVATVVIDLLRELKPPLPKVSDDLPGPRSGLSAHSFVTLHQGLEDLERDLSARHRALVELRFLGECTLDEIADLMGITRDQVYRESRVALVYLRQKLGASFPNFGTPPGQHSRG